MDLTPILSITAKTVQGQFLDRTLTALCDSGSTNTMINQQCLPFGVEPTQGPTKKKTTISRTADKTKATRIGKLEAGPGKIGETTRRTGETRVGTTGTTKQNKTEGAKAKQMAKEQNKPKNCR